MLRFCALVIGLSVLASGCGGASPSASTTPPPAPAPTTAAPALQTTSAPDGTAAPDFSTTLGDGSGFTLSSATKPVYMVFWAEW